MAKELEARERLSILDIVSSTLWAGNSNVSKLHVNMQRVWFYAHQPHYFLQII